MKAEGAYGRLTEQSSHEEIGFKYEQEGEKNVVLIPTMCQASFEVSQLLSQSSQPPLRSEAEVIYGAEA